MLGGNEARSDGSKIENAIHGVDDIGAWFAIDNQQDCGFAVGESAGAKIFHGVGHGGDIADAHRRAILVADEQGPVRFGFE